MSTPDITPTSQMTNDEMFESLTGFDEIAVAKAFAAEITDLAEHRPLAFQRALVFVELRRGAGERTGLPDAEAKTTAMEMTVKAASGYFTADEDETDPEQPATESGKDDAPPPSLPSPSDSGAS